MMMVDGPMRHITCEHAGMLAAQHSRATIIVKGQNML